MINPSNTVINEKSDNISTKKKDEESLKVNFAFWIEEREKKIT